MDGWVVWVIVLGTYFGIGLLCCLVSLVCWLCSFLREYRRNEDLERAIMLFTSNSPFVKKGKEKEHELGCLILCGILFSLLLLFLVPVIPCVCALGYCVFWRVRRSFEDYVDEGSYNLKKCDSERKLMQHRTVSNKKREMEYSPVSYRAKVGEDGVIRSVTPVLVDERGIPNRILTRTKTSIGEYSFSGQGDSKFHSVENLEGQQIMVLNSRYLALHEGRTPIFERKYCTRRYSIYDLKEERICHSYIGKAEERVAGIYSVNENIFLTQHQQISYERSRKSTQTRTNLFCFRNVRNNQIIKEFRKDLGSRPIISFSHKYICFLGTDEEKSGMSKIVLEIMNLSTWKVLKSELRKFPPNLSFDNFTGIYVSSRSVVCCNSDFLYVVDLETATIKKTMSDEVKKTPEFSFPLLKVIPNYNFDGSFAYCRFDSVDEKGKTGGRRDFFYDQEKKSFGEIDLLEFSKGNRKGVYYFVGKFAVLKTLQTGLEYMNKKESFFLYDIDDGKVISPGHDFSHFCEFQYFNRDQVLLVEKNSCSVWVWDMPVNKKHLIYSSRFDHITKFNNSTIIVSAGKRLIHLKVSFHKEIRTYVNMCWSKKNLPTDVLRYVVFPYLARSYDAKTYRLWKHCFKTNRMNKI